MKNGFNIEWTFEAEQNLNAIFDYLEATWTEREIKAFAQKLEHNLQIISEYPKTFPYYDESKTARRCVLSPQTTIYYRDISTENKIVILTLFDNRRNPDTLKITI
ncbi:MAG: type II toxin-antitoxin system RelE/ParE family toxin [Bacteroidales bacterium]|nr:type II toxin-antitoxin system RelE/ParE family toxin [Bacteroidales bacterium]